MLQVKTKIQQSPIHGIGLFAAADITAGSPVWKFDKRFDQYLAPEVILALPEVTQAYLARYAYKSKRTGKYILDSDDGKFFNHADDPNTATRTIEGEEEDVIFSVRDIKSGEELTLNYANQEDDLTEDNILNTFYEKLHLVDELDPRLKREA